MTFGALAAISLLAIAGPVLALPLRLRLPVVIGELLAGVLAGAAGWLHADQPTFRFLADVGFALVMFVAGTHVPVRDERVRRALAAGAGRAAAVGVVAAGAGWLLATGFGTAHAALYAVLMASSSAALVVPILGSFGFEGEGVLPLLAQVAVADTACIVALPLVIDPRHAGRAALGACLVVLLAAVLFLGLRELERSGWRRRVHEVSEQRKFALELRINLVLLFGLAFVAEQLQVSVLLAGFSFGLVVAAVGEPRRLARQLFAVTEGFFGPLFFVWLGVGLDLHGVSHHPSYIGLGLALGVGAVACHAVMRVTGQGWSLAGLAAAQLGVPVAAAALGTRHHLLAPGEGAALVLGALVTMGVAAVSGAVEARRVDA